jgi:DNA-binding beta-propeller fold protein YncE
MMTSRPGRDTFIAASAIFVLIAATIATTGCFKQVAETRRSLPNIIWPAPPEIPRIRFVNSVSRPEDMNIRGTVLKNILRFIKGKKKVPIVSPSDIIKGKDDSLYIVDNFQHIVHVMNSEKREYHYFPEGQTTFKSPIGIAIDDRELIYVTDSKEGVVKVFGDRGKVYIKEFGRGLLARPTGIAFNPVNSEILVVDTVNADIVRYDSKSHRVRAIIGKEGDETGLFHYPTHITVAKNGNIIVSDSLNFRIQVLSPSGKFIRAFGKVGDSPGYFSRPKGVAVDSDGNIYVVDAMFDNVQIFNESGQLLMDFGRPGNAYGEFWLPSGIYIDDDDMIYVADSYNHRVQIFEYIKRDEFIKSSRR